MEEAKEARYASGRRWPGLDRLVGLYWDQGHQSPEGSWVMGSFPVSCSSSYCSVSV